MDSELETILLAVVYPIIALCIFWYSIRESYSQSPHKAEDTKCLGFVIGAGWPLILLMVVAILPLMVMEWACSKEW